MLTHLRSLGLDFIDPPLLGRVGFSKKIIRKDPRVINDDVVCYSVPVFGRYFLTAILDYV